MTTIYTNKCPFCGTYISIKDATLCPGCAKSIYYGPDPHWSWHKSTWDSLSYYYYANKQERDQAIRNKVAVDKYWASEEGIKHAEEIRLNRLKNQQEIQDAASSKSIKGLIGILLIFSIPVAWFFGGWEWDNFGKFGWPALIFGILFIGWGSS